MTTKSKKKPVKMIVVVVVAFLFACNSGSRQNQTISQTEQNILGTTSDDATEINNETEPNSDANNNETNKTLPESNTKFRPAAMPAGLVDVPPLLNGKHWYEELNFKYVFENNNFRKIVDEAGITGYWDVGCLFFIDEDGSVDTSERMPTAGLFIRINRDGIHLDAKAAPPEYQLITNEFLRIINSTQGKWTRAMHDGKPMKVRINSGFVSDKLE